MPKYTMWRNATITEVYEVTAASEEQAREKLFNGECDPIHTEWVDWATDSWELEHVEDELVTFLNSKDPATAMDIG
jgi:hypothetical protein